MYKGGIGGVIACIFVCVRRAAYRSTPHRLPLHIAYRLPKLTYYIPTSHPPLSPPILHQNSSHTPPLSSPILHQTLSQPLAPGKRNRKDLERERVPGSSGVDKGVPPQKPWSSLSEASPAASSPGSMAAAMAEADLGYEVMHLRQVNEALVERIESMERRLLKTAVREREGTTYSVEVTTGRGGTYACMLGLVVGQGVEGPGEGVAGR